MSNKDSLNEGVEQVGKELASFVDRFLDEYNLSHAAIYSILQFEAARIMRDWIKVSDGIEPEEGESWKNGTCP